MAGRPRRPSSELGPDLSSSTSPKRTRRTESAAEEAPKEEEEREVEEGLETTEKLPPGDIPEGSSSSPETPTSLSERKPGGSPETVETPERKPRSPEPVETAERKSESPKPAPKSDEPVAGPSKPKEAPPTVSREKESSAGTSAAVPSTSTMGREVTGQVQTSLTGEHSRYEELSLIGNGAYGTVYKAKDLNSGQVVALKKVRVPLTEDGLPTSTLREIAALKQLEPFEHPYIVRLLDVCQGNYLDLPSADERSERVDRGLILWLVFEHVERDLASYMSSCRPSGIPSHVVKQMSKEILLGVDFLHSHRIIHRDLKPQNLLVTRDGHIKIADFGLAKTYDFEMRLTSVVVTLWYRSPEVLLGCPYASPVDIWSVGCIFAELNTLQPLFPGTSEGDQLDRIFRIIGTPSQQEWPENVSVNWTAFPPRQRRPLRTVIVNLNDDGLDLIRAMLLFDPHSRPSAAEALRHRYFAEDDS